MNYIKNTLKLLLLPLLIGPTLLNGMQQPAKRQRTEEPVAQSLPAEGVLQKPQHVLRVGRETKTQAATQADTIKSLPPALQGTVSEFTVNHWGNPEAWLAVEPVDTHNKTLAALCSENTVQGNLVIDKSNKIADDLFASKVWEITSTHEAPKLIATVLEQREANTYSSYLKLNENTLITTHKKSFDHSEATFKIWNIADANTTKLMYEITATSEHIVHLVKINDSTFMCNINKHITTWNVSDQQQPELLATSEQSLYAHKNANTITHMVKLSHKHMLTIEAAIRFFPNQQEPVLLPYPLMSWVSLWDISKPEKTKRVATFICDRRVRDIIKLSNSTFATLSGKDLSIWSLENIQPTDPRLSEALLDPSHAISLTAQLPSMTKKLICLPEKSSFILHGNWFKSQQPPLNNKHYKANEDALKEFRELGYQDHLRLDTLIKRLRRHKKHSFATTQKDHFLNARLLQKMPANIQATLKQNFNITDSDIAYCAYLESLEDPFASGELDLAFARIFNKPAQN